jgi:CheY-specific phosphatase CheX
MSALKTVEPGSVLPRTAWPAILTETVVEVFTLMVGASVAVARDSPRVPFHVTGVVGIAGVIRANFILQCTSACANKLAAQMLGVSPDAPDSQKAAYDALGEICNIVAGYFKAKVGLGDVCMLSVPTIIVGQDYRFHSPVVYDRLELPLAFDGETLWATLEIAS